MSTIPSLLLLTDSSKRPLFDSLAVADAHACVRRFLHLSAQDIQRCNTQKLYSRQKLEGLGDNVVAFIDLLNQKIRANNQVIARSCCRLFLNKIVKCISLNWCSLYESEVDPQQVLKKIKQLKAAFIIQNAWRSHFRKKLLKEKTTYEEWQIKKLQSKWLDNPLKEQKRLRHFRYYSFEELFVRHNKRDCEVALRNIVGRIQEVKEFYRNTHYVFTHGQSLSISLINQAIKEALCLFTPRFYHPLAPSFRIPGTVPHTATITDFFKKYNVDSPIFNNNSINIELLSVDSYLWNMNSYQSALDFLCMNDNICTIHDPDKLKKLFLSILTHYVANDFICANLAEKFNQLNTQIQSESKIGVLYAICIPKVLVQDPKRNFVYRAHPLGIRCSCHPANHIPILEQLQNNQTHPCTNHHMPDYNGFNPQYRFLTSSMMGDKANNRTLGVRALVADSFTASTRASYHTKVQKLMQALHFYGRLFTMATALSPAEEALFLKDAKKLIKENKELDFKILLPLIRRRTREGKFSVETREALFKSLNIIDTGNRFDEYWIDRAVTAAGIQSVWSSVTSFFSLFRFW